MLPTLANLTRYSMTTSINHRITRNAQIRHYEHFDIRKRASADPEGGQGVRTPPPPGKSQVIWVSIGNKQLDPPPGKSWTPPPPLENVGPPLEQ